MKETESTHMGRNILVRIASLWNDLPDTFSQEDLTSLIKQVTKEFRSLDIEPPPEGYQECRTIFFRDFQGPNVPFITYIYREVGEMLDIQFLKFLAYYTVGIHFLDEENDPFAALDCFNQAYNLWFDDLSEQYYFGNVARAHLLLQEWDIAIKYLERAIDIATVNDDEGLLGMHYQNKGVAHRGKYELQQAKRCYMIALRISEKRNDHFLNIRRRNLSEIERDIVNEQSGFVHEEFMLHMRAEMPGRDVSIPSANFRRIMFNERDIMDCPFFKNQWVLGASGTKYYIHSGIGSGAIGLVYLVSDEEASPPHYAMKVLAPNRQFRFLDFRVERFEREIRLLSNIAHPNVVQLLDQGKVFGHILFYIMPYYEENFREIINRAKWLNREILIDYVGGIWRGIHALHRIGIIHRDLKPENILMNGDSPAISDLGIAFIESGNRITRTNPKTKLGTRDYMAPEQVKSPHSVSEKADYYSFGVILFELLTGTVPLPRANVSKVLSANLEQWGVSRRKPIVNFIESLMAPDPAKRPGAQEIEDTLSKIRHSFLQGLH